MGKILDVSHHNPSSSFNWSQTAKDIDLLIIRVQYGSSTIDHEYKNHVANAKKFNIPFGHYAYGLFVSVADAKKEAQDFLNRMDKSAKFVVLDVEKDTVANCGTTHLAEASQAFIDTCKAAGYKVGFYVSHEMYESYGLNKVKADFLWLPRYGKNDGTPNMKPDYPCDIWQYTENGRVAGYSGNVDLSLLNGSKKLDWFLGVQPKPIENVQLSKPVTQHVQSKPAQQSPSTPTKPTGKWVKENNQWFYYENGKKRIGWFNDGKHWFYLKEGTGQMITGWYQVASHWYYFDQNGYMICNDWMKSKGKDYYLNDKGQMVTGQYTINGKIYNFDKNGALIK